MQRKVVVEDNFVPFMGVKNSNSKFYIVRHFNANPFGNGGEKRSYQIEQLVRRYIPNSTVITVQKQAVHWWQFIMFVVFLLRKKWPVPWQRFMQPGGLLKGYHFWRSIPANVLNDSEAVFFWEATLPAYSFFPGVVKGVVYALPHNLESLVPNQKMTGWANDEVKKKLVQEMAMFQKCKSVGTIAREENWLLELVNINTHYLPYFAMGDILKQCNFIATERREKQASFKKSALILGTAGNPPTKLGMEQLLKVIASLQHANYHFHIAGYGTECFQNTVDCEYVTVHGSVHQSVLDRLLIDVDFVIINQKASSGALTKLAEFAHMRVPVLCNEAAARSFHNLPNLTIYSDVQQLYTLLDGRLNFADFYQYDFDEAELKWKKFFESAC